MEKDMAWSRTAREVYRDGPVGAPSQPAKEEIRPLLKQYEDAIAALTQMTGAIAAKGTLAELNTVSASPGDIGIVFTGDDAGVYKRVSGSWVKQYDLPSDIAQLAADAADAAQSAAEGARDVALLAKNQAISAASAVQSEQPSRAYAIGNYHPLVAPDFIRTAGFYQAGDGGGAVYRHVLSEPAHEGKFSISLGLGGSAWFEIVADGGADVKAFGAKGDGVTNDIPFILKAYRWACLNVVSGRPFGTTIRFGQRGTYLLGAPDSGDANYLTDSGCILTLDGYGVQIVGVKDAVITRPVGTWSTIAVQGDEHFIDLVCDFNWDDDTSETWPSTGLRREVYYVTGNKNRITGIVRNCPGDGVQVDGMQRFGVRQEVLNGSGKLIAPTLPYADSICGIGNDFTGIRVENCGYGGITNYWSRGTVIANATVEKTGCEGITFDTYSSKFRCIGNTIRKANLPGRLGGVGGIGADSSRDGLIAMNIIDDVRWNGGFTAGIHLRADENATLRLQLLGNTLINCGGPGIHLDATVATSASLGLPAGTVRSPKYNTIGLNTFISCGADPAFRASLGGTPPPFTAIVIMYNAADPAIENVIGVNNISGHAIIDAPLSDWSGSDPTNPNGTLWGQLQQSDLSFIRGRLAMGARVEDRIIDLYDNGTDRYGWGMATNEMRQYVPSTASLVFGTRTGSAFFPRWSINAAGAFVPGNNFEIGQGASGSRVGTIYTTVSPNVSSDARIKELIDDEELMMKALRAVASVPMHLFYRKDLGGARKHFGPLAQDIVAAFEAEDMNAEAWDLIYRDEATGFLGVTMATFDRMRAEAIRLKVA